MDLISIVVPVYKVEQYFFRCIDSIRKQTYQNLEIILVDDGSPDRCPEFCEQVKCLDSRVKVIHKENGGLGFARNAGLEVVTGTYVTFIDSDDWIAADHIENLYREANKTRADAVIGSHTRVTADGKIRNPSFNLEKRIYTENEVQESIVIPLIGADVASSEDIQLQPSSCMNLYRSDVIETNHIRFPSEKVAISEDLFFNVDFFSHASRVTAINEQGYFYFENMGSISRKYDSGRLERTVRFYEEMKICLERNRLEEVAGLRLTRTFLMDIRFLLRMVIASDMTRKEKLQEIQKVLENRQVRTAILNYPVDTYSPAMRLLTKMIYNRNAKGVYFLITMREHSRKKDKLKPIFRLMGIGR